jgi:hypothetical protein
VGGHAGAMKSKQLANVLFKIIGISFFLHGIPSFISGFLMGFLLLAPPSAPRNTWIYTVAGVVQLVVAALFIIKSRNLAEFFFRNETE